MTTDKVYISGALMAAKNLDRVKQLYNDIASVCSKNGLQPYLPHNNTDPIKNSKVSDKDVFKKDFEELVKSSLVISYIGEPSLGVGAELSICVSNQIPVITVTESKRKVSRFLKGMLQTTDNVQTIEFDNKNDLKEKLNECLKSFLHNAPGQLMPTHLHSHLLLQNAQIKTAKAKESASKRTVQGQAAVLS